MDDFREARKKQKRLIIILAVVALLTLIVLWQGGFLTEPRIFPEEVFRPESPQINFEVLNNPVWQEAQHFDQIAPFDGDTGRQNPFLPN